MFFSRISFSYSSFHNKIKLFINFENEKVVGEREERGHEGWGRRTREVVGPTFSVETDSQGGTGGGGGPPASLSDPT